MYESSPFVTQYPRNKMKCSVNKINKNPYISLHCWQFSHPEKLKRHPSPTLVNPPFSLSNATCVHGQLGQRALYAFFDDVDKTHPPSRLLNSKSPLASAVQRQREGLICFGGPLPRAACLVTRFQEHDAKEVSAPIRVQRGRIRKWSMDRERPVRAALHRQNLRILEGGIECM